MLLVWGLAFSAVAHADDAPPAPLMEGPAVTLPREGPASSTSNGVVSGSHLNFVFRNYSDALDVEGGPHSHAWVQGMMANFESGDTGGLIGFGVAASLYAALKLDGGAGADNMVHVANGGGSNQVAWAYPGLYNVKARVSNTVFRYGLQAVDNPFMAPHDNRALPPTFLGTTILGKPFSSAMFEAGSFTKNVARGQTTLTRLRTQYGDTPISRLSYVGGKWDHSPHGELVLYANQADDVWRQYYASVKHSLGSTHTLRWTGAGNVYSTHDTGRARQGSINNNAYSLSLAAQHGPHELLLGYQQILGDQFFDYLNETDGIALANSADADYNAPHEKSVQLRYTFYGEQAGLPGFKAMIWAVTGWGADGSAGAANDPGKSSVYWSNGAPVQGRHHEFGVNPSYTFRSGKLKNAKVEFIAMWHHGSAHYSEATSREYRLLVSVPLNAF
ncbi:OprD family outer membrane porin [Pandoraea oxalativorans]|uniref:Porin n=1 Tax=Pandoraea oxalativorans TaxID=573737 RepID=A0A0G3IIU9_9BURK|nr:OprD family outer membrane porin [Pandoraea oxalativorans]AKK25020.2 porin [Pandoraea oxalativorans]